ncbi:hypothetical protein [Nesterenkonia rhizosphaerae]|uniref:Uncharacterized protein n=1 Tax=Nesterenkonia rhizosphaerae TaxID=1348272 RepID=A0ABP9G089_9MICC
MADNDIYSSQAPSPEQVQLISAAYVLTGPKSEYKNFTQWREEFNLNLRDIGIAARETSNRMLVDKLLDMENLKRPFWAVVRGVLFHEGSQRYIVQLETEDRASAEIKIEYIATERVDGSGNGKFLGEWLSNDLLDHRIRVHKYVGARDKKKYKEILHIEPGGKAEELSQDEIDDLTAELEDHVHGCIGSGKCRHSND